MATQPRAETEGVSLGNGRLQGPWVGNGLPPLQSTELGGRERPQGFPQGTPALEIN